MKKLNRNRERALKRFEDSVLDARKSILVDDGDSLAPDIAKNYLHPHKEANINPSRIHQSSRVEALLKGNGGLIHPWTMLSWCFLTTLILSLGLYWASSTVACSKYLHKMQ